jgi:UDP-GlcNAc:undecaprenyl-phosphate/decaprenyl-phosphate GlcNAc-1-phosphate transferase
MITKAGSFYLVAASGAAFLAALISYLLTPIVQRAALRYGAAHQPRARDLHTRPVARWGGLAIYAAFMITIFASVIVIDLWFDRRLHWPTMRAGAGIFVAGTLLSILGAIDDLLDLSPARQMAVQVLCALLVIPFGIRIEILTDPFHPGQWIALGAWGPILTVLWLVAVTNAINWIDGLDGLAAGVSAIAAMTLALMAVQSKQPALALLGAALCGSLLGFLRHNFNPAKIFMGGGSLFVGFTLASISVVGAFKVAATMAILVPILILGVPIFDTAFVILRRALGGRPIYQADKSHFHHRLLERGFSQRQAVVIIYIVSIGLSAAAVLLCFRGSL